jgi:glycosyltransferase involved in cell wall biosynthesis
MQINLHSPINMTSYGYVSSYLLRELKRIDVDIYHLGISGHSPDEMFDESVFRNTVEFDQNAPSLKIWHQNDLSSILSGGVRHVGFPIFELETFNEIEKISLTHPDRLFVCSQWAKDIISREIQYHDEDTIDVIPLGYDPEIFKPASMPIGTTRFANFGKFEVRKGHDVLPRIFNRAFTKDDDVELIMMPHNFFLDQNETNRWVKSFINTPLGGKIKFVNRVNSHKMVYNIMKDIHCGIFPARAEGWNLEALELLACGKHLIITNCTGHTEFCNSENSMLVDMVSPKETAYDGKFFNGEHQWNSIGKDEEEQMIEYMRKIHKLNKDNNLEQNAKAIDSVKKFTWNNSALKIKELI